MRATDFDCAQCIVLSARKVWTVCEPAATCVYRTVRLPQLNRVRPCSLVPGAPRTEDYKSETPPHADGEEERTIAWIKCMARGMSADLQLLKAQRPDLYEQVVQNGMKASFALDSTGRTAFTKGLRPLELGGFSSIYNVREEFRLDSQSADAANVVLVADGALLCV